MCNAETTALAEPVARPRRAGEEVVTATIMCCCCGLEGPASAAADDLADVLLLPFRERKTPPKSLPTVPVGVDLSVVLGAVDLDVVLEEGTAPDENFASLTDRVVKTRLFENGPVSSLTQ